MYWGYDSAAQKFYNHFFNDQGPYDEAGSTYEGVVADDKLSFTGPARFQDELDADGMIKVNPHGTITVTRYFVARDAAWIFSPGCSPISTARDTITGLRPSSPKWIS